MPLATAISSACEAVRSSVLITALSPDGRESRNLRTAVLMDDRTDLLRRRAFSLVLIRLIWDLIFATRATPTLKERFSTDPNGSGPGTRFERGRIPAGAGWAQIRGSLSLKSTTRTGYFCDRFFKGVDRINGGAFDRGISLRDSHHCLCNSLW